MSLSALTTLLLVSVTSPGDGQGLLRGVIFEAESARPLANAQIQVAGRPLRSSKNGAFKVRLPAGKYPMSVKVDRKDGSSAVFMTQEVTVRKNAVTEVLLNVPMEGKGAFSVDVEEAGERAPPGTEELDPETLKGSVKGVVRDEKNGRPIAGALVFVRGYPIEAKTDKDGRFVIKVPIGTASISVLKSGYSAESLKTVPVAEGDNSVEVKLKRRGVELEAYVVLAPEIVGDTLSLMNERKDSSTVSDIIGAEQMSKSGDSSAAGALKRVTGVTVVGGKYVYVRGLGERYSSTLMNGLALPSPEPDQRVVPLDLFPTHILDSVVIQKTASADLPAEFGGGTVMLRTRSFPNQFFTALGVSSGILTGTTFEEGYRGVGGPTDFLGIDGGFRALPEAMQAATDESLLLESDQFSSSGFTSSELEVLGESLKNRYGITKEESPANLGLNFAIGDQWKVLGGRGGFVFTTDYGSKWKGTKRDITIYNVGGDGELSFMHGYDLEQLVREVSLSAFLSGGLEWEDDSVSLTSMVVRSTDDMARQYEGYNGDLGDDIRVRRIRWVERMLVSNQLVGSHTIKDWHKLKLDWGYGVSLASRLEPDRVETRQDREGATDAWFLSDRPEGNQRVFSDLQDWVHSGRFDFELPYDQWAGEESKLKWGFSAYGKMREVDTRRYKFGDRGPLSSDETIAQMDPADIFVPEHIGVDGYQLTEVTLSTDSFTADHVILSGYLMTELPITNEVTLIAGLRMEGSEQVLETFKPFSPTLEKERADLTTYDVLPSFLLQYQLNPKMVLRGGYGRTISRPNFRELSPAVSIDLTGGRLRFGNPELDRAFIDSGDISWQWYLEAGEVVSVGAFYKYFTKPIETVVIPSAQLSVSYANAESAVNYGVEFDFRKNFSFIDVALRDLFLGGNVAWIQSNVNLSAEASTNTSKERALEGQSPFVINFQFGYDNPDTGTVLTLLYNVFGRRIVEVGALGAPDVYEEPFHQFDIVAKQKLPGGFSLSAKFKNLLDAPVEFAQGDKVILTFHKGREFSLGIGKKF